MLFGLKPTDPVTLVSATVIFLTVAAIAGYLPARTAPESNQWRLCGMSSRL
jgi:hypothetical protein